MNEKRSYTEYTVVGSPQQYFDIGFEDYQQDKDMLKITVDNKDITEAGYTVVRNVGQTLEFTPPVPVDSVVRIQRVTDIDAPFYIFTAGNQFVPSNVDQNFKQLLHSQQEVRDGFVKLQSDVVPLVIGLPEALDKAQESADAAQAAAKAAEEAAETTKSASNVFDSSGKSIQFMNDVRHIREPELYGAVGGTVNDQLAFTNLPKDYTYSLGSKYNVPVFRAQAKNFIGNSTVINVDSVNGDTTVCVQIQPNSIISDVKFVNTDKAKKSWTYAAIGSGAHLTKVGFYNFDDNVEPKNSWGCYIEGAASNVKRGITLDSVDFGGNGVSDIAVLDHVHDLTILNPTNSVDNGVLLDIEPNVEGNVSGINLIGGHYRQISVLENSFNTYGIKGVNITGAIVDLLELRGGQVDATGSIIKNVKGNWANAIDYAGYQNEFFGSLRADNLNLSTNLIKDSYVTDINRYDSTSYWSIYAPNNFSTYRKHFTGSGYLTELNGDRTGYQQITTRNAISIPAGFNKIAVVLNYEIINQQQTMFEPVIISFLNSSGAVIGKDSSIKGGRVSDGSTFSLTTEVSIMDVPTGAVSFQLSIRSNKDRSILRVKRVGVFGLSVLPVHGNFNSVLDAINTSTSVTITTPYVQASIAATGTHVSTHALIGVDVGDVVQVSASADLGTGGLLWCAVTSKDVVSVYVHNLNTTSALNLNAKYKLIK